MIASTDGSRRAALLFVLSLAGSIVGIVVGCHGDLRFNELSGCIQDRDCLLASLHCSSGRCVACTSDAHCASPTPRCDVAIHRCVECGVMNDCPDGTVCRTGHCEVSCASSPTACPAATPMCDDGACVQCDEGVGCANAVLGPLCIDHVCSACTKDADCGSSTPRCDPVAHQCVVCQDNADCPAATPLCDPVPGRCLALP